MEIKSDLKVILDEISERLYSGHASIMVGSGFSKNADPNGEGVKKFLSWNELADIFFEKVYGKPPNHNDRYLNPIKIAEELNANFGRTTLDKIILKNLPDKDYSPSVLHKDLIALPWNNIFTTNYDTLLERASELSKERYDTVINQHDLVYSKEPRIIKLHGSFPSSKPFIVTEEDYRTYPQKFPLFVNTVQQALIENTLCLIGFSGDDPNFLHWAGWIRDNIGNKQSPKIYLIGYFDIPESQRKLLELRNITVVNLASCVEENMNKHKNALSFFIDYLKDKESEEIKLEWPKNKSKYAPNFEQGKHIENELSEITKEWKQTRLSYPGWVVCPYDNRKTLWRDTEQWQFGKHLALTRATKTLLEFWYELTWRIEKCLLPIMDSHAEIVKEIILSAENFVWDETTQDSSLYEKWMLLQLVILRYLRESGKRAEWEEYHKKVSERNSKGPSLFTVRLLFEKTYLHLFYQEFEFLPTLFDEIKNQNLTAFEKARLGSMMAEFGLLNEAHSILEEALSAVRMTQNLKPVTDDYSSLSQESHILQILKLLKDDGSYKTSHSDGKRRKIDQYYSKLLRKNKYKDNNSNIYEDEPDENIKNYLDEYKDRWSTLKIYKCDPWVELEYFKSKLEDKPNPFQATTKVNNYDIGSYSISIKMGGDDPEKLLAFNFFRYVEEIAIPLKVNHFVYGQECIQGAALRIHKEAPFWSLMNVFRSGASKSIKHIFDRESVASMSSEEVNGLVDFCIKRLEVAEEIILGSNSFRESNIAVRIGTLAPEILSRLATKCSLENKRNILSFLSKMYETIDRTKYGGASNLSRRLIGAWPIEDYENLVPLLLQNFKLLDKNNTILDREFPDPILFVDIKKFSHHNKKLKIPHSIISNALDAFEDSNKDLRENIFYRLAILHDLGSLNREEQSRFGNILWQQRDSDRFPILGPNKYNFWFLNLPCPKDVDPYGLFSTYIKKLEPPIQGKSIASLGGRDSYFYREFMGAKDYLGKEVAWGLKDAESILLTVGNWLEDEMTSLKEREKGPFADIKDEPRRRLAHAVKVLAYVVAPFLDKSLFKKYEKRIQHLNNYLSNLGVSVSTLTAELYSNKETRNLDFIKITRNDSSSKTLDISFPALIGITRAIEKTYNDDSCKKERSNLLNELVSHIYLRNFPNIISALGNLTYLVRNIKDFDLIEVHSRLSYGLDRIRVETSLNSRVTDIAFDELLHARESAAELAYAIYKDLRTKGDDIPDSIERWRNICNSPEEFSEVRNQWMQENSCLE